MKIIKTLQHGGVDPRVEESFCVEFACSPHVSLGFLWVLQLPPTVHRHAG